MSPALPASVISKASVNSYSLRFKTPVRTSTGDYDHRYGAILQITDDSGLTGTGDAAPWGSYIDTLDEDLQLAAAKLLDRPIDIETIEGELSKISASPALQYALELALLDILGQKLDLPLWAVLAKTNSSTHEAIEINAVAVDSKDAIARCDEGFTGLKIKIGANDLATDIDRVRRVREAVGPYVTIRVDANGAYDFDSARQMAGAMSDLGVALFEQPVSTTEQLIALKRHTSVPIGADEVVSSDPAFSEHMGSCADFIVIKPMALGGLLPSLRMAKAADALGLGVIITSSWESIIGRTGALHLAAAVRSVSKNQPTKIHSGLAHPFSEDLAPLWPIVRGAAELPVAPGLGVKTQGKWGQV